MVKEKAGHRRNGILLLGKGEGALEGSQLLVHILLVTIIHLGLMAPLQVKMPVGGEGKATVRPRAANEAIGGVDGHVELLHGVILNEIITTPNSVAGHCDHVRKRTGHSRIKERRTILAWMLLLVLLVLWLLLLLILILRRLLSRIPCLSGQTSPLHHQRIHRR